jgi:hypothetical protein
LTTGSRPTASRRHRATGGHGALGGSSSWGNAMVAFGLALVVVAVLVVILR